MHCAHLRMKEVNNKRKHVLSKAQYDLSVSDIKKLLSTLCLFLLAVVVVKIQQKVGWCVCWSCVMERTPERQRLRHMPSLLAGLHFGMSFAGPRAE